MKSNPRSPDLYVLDSLANDIEDLEGILRMLNSNTELGWATEWGRPFQREELVTALSRLVTKGYVQVFALAADGKSLEPLAPTVLPPGTYQDTYFGMTDRGRLIHRNWDPNVEGNACGGSP